MAEENTEICGFLDIKYLNGKCKANKVKKRTLAPWKVWRRRWCSIKKLGPGLGIKVQLDYSISNNVNTLLNDKDSSLIIPSDVIICRTQSRSKQFAFGVFPSKERKPLIYFAGTSETETQRWMANIRELLRPRKNQFSPGSYSISVVDNAHSKASGLIGLYGDLVANTTGIFIKDAHSGEQIATFDWKEFGQFHHSTTGHPEDVKCICVIHTTKSFHGGVGELHIFCLEASKLLQELVTQGRGPRNRPIRRPLSLSEGDLRISKFEEAQRNYSILIRTVNKSRKGTIEYEQSSLKVQNKQAENVYQPEPFSIPNVTSNRGDWSSSAYDRRISDISVASGIYEEIADEVESDRATSSRFCMDEFFHNYRSDEPPPLPPRQRCASESMKGVRSQDVLISERGILSAMPTRNSGQSEQNSFALQKIADTCNYVPMSPRLKDLALHHLQTQTALQENDYVIMR
ncbi:uncharacterized protein LOC143214895 [Lasioglossum baleicum]|uniref:uncharacterized protein LOC143214895 n=1 Tax=Lasioglossum baleicum TaxID=434251 RepID=UPI003FCCB52C